VQHFSEEENDVVFISMRKSGPTPRSTNIRDLVFGALTEVTAGGSSAPISWWDGANRQAAPGRPHGGRYNLSTCTFLRLRGRAVMPWSLRVRMR
jgi:hypothetical protein